MERIRQKIGNIKLYLSYIEDLAKDCDRRINHDVVYRGALLYYLYLMADTCISLAEIVIKYRDLRPPQSYSDAFDVLGEHEILEKEFAYSFAKIAGFRNLLAHDYEKINTAKICQDILKQLPEVYSYIQQVKQALNL